MAGSDPGFSVKGGANPPGGTNIQFCQNFQKVHEIENILGLGRGWGRRGHLLLDRPINGGG